MSTIEEIYRAYSDDVYRFAYWLCGDVSEAEDIVSDTFLRLWGSLDDVRVRSVKAYILTIAHNVFVSGRRRSRRYRQLPEWVPDSSPPPDVTAEKNDEIELLMSAVRALPAGEQAAFLMRFQHDLPYAEIARSLGISLSAAKVRVHRARVKLAEVRTTSGG